MNTKKQRTAPVVYVLFAASSIFYFIAVLNIVTQDNNNHLYYLPLGIIFSVLAITRQNSGDEHEADEEKSAPETE